MNRLLLNASVAAFACSVSSLPLAAVAESANPGLAPAPVAVEAASTFAPAAAMKLGGIWDSAQFGPTRLLPVTKAELSVDPVLFSPVLTGEAAHPAAPIAWAANDSDFGLGGEVIAHRSVATASIERCSAVQPERGIDLIPDAVSVKACGERLGEVLQDLQQERWQYSYLTAAELAPICISADDGTPGSLARVCEPAVNDGSANWQQAAAEIDKLMNSYAFDFSSGNDRADVLAQQQQFSALFAWTTVINVPVIASGEE